MRIVASRCGFLREIVLLAGAVRVENADFLVFDSCEAGGVVMLADLAGLAGDIAVFAAISFFALIADYGMPDVVWDGAPR